MVELAPISASEGFLPLSIGNYHLNEAAIEQAYIVAPYPGHQGEVARILNINWPNPGEYYQGENGSLLWFGREQAMLIGAFPAEELSEYAAVIPQYGAWVIMRLSGPNVEDVLARLVPLDLHCFKPCQTARTLLNHIAISITRIDETCFEIWGLRSMAHSIVNEISAAMRHVTARDRI